MNNQSILSIASVIAKTVSKIGFAGLITSVAMLSQATNAAPNPATTIPLDICGMNITKHEIAVMQVLSEICPPMLNGKQKQRFYKSYTVQLHELMPSLEDPKAAIQYLSTQQDYRRYYKASVAGPWASLNKKIKPCAKIWRTLNING